MHSTLSSALSNTATTAINIEWLLLGRRSNTAELNASSQAVGLFGWKSVVRC
jgi:hypothetical protein